MKVAAARTKQLCGRGYAHAGNRPGWNFTVKVKRLAKHLSNVSHVLCRCDFPKLWYLLIKGDVSERGGDNEA